MLKNFIIILLLFFTANVFATHNRAGEISFTHVSGLTYEVTVVTYVKESSPAERPNLGVFWGDGTVQDSIERVSQISLGNDIEKNTYVAQHTYPGPSPFPYLIRVEDPNRNAGIINVPNSVNIIFYLQTELYINPFLGSNNSPQLLNPPIDNACVGFTYVHNPGAIDVDGDSLYYSLSPSMRENGTAIPGYNLPQASNFITIDNSTGDLIWDSPLAMGEYNVAILIEEFRNGNKIGSILRDMQITVVAGCDPPPNVVGVTDTCVIAGDTLDIDFSVSGSYPVTLTSTGIPYLVGNPAVFQQTSAPSVSTTANFYWQTNCSNVRKSAYTTSIKAVQAGPYNLADFHTTRIKVIAPKPENLTTSVLANTITLSWDQSVCSPISQYKIYRKLGTSSWSPGACETGIPAGIGFQLIGTTNSLTNTTFSDDNNGNGLVIGEEYCYRVVACFPDGAESIASDEACDHLVKDVAVITRVNVNTTDQNNGSIYVEWSKPTEHNTTQFPGPYRYLVYRGEQNTNNMVLIDSTASINDTSYTDTLLNTKDFEYYYRIDIYNLTGGVREFMGSSTVASSVYLNLTPSDNQITLSWNEKVPWANSQYVIYKQNPITLNFDSLNITSNQTYVDTGLANLKTYCYKIKSIGTYSLPGTISPIENASQENCAQPIDNVIPCPPSLCIEVNCEAQENKLYWQIQNPGCADDILQFNIYRKDSLTGEYDLIMNIPNGTDTSYLHNNIESIVGCYVITGIDSVGNESAYSDSVCVDNPNGACAGNLGCVSTPTDLPDTACNVYRLPNVFTPGGDGKNDFVIPFPYSFVESVEVEIYNRWGQLVFKTTDPDIIWDGTNQENQSPCADGTYYYVCTINEICLDGSKPRVIKGFVTLIRNK
ncbi:MAG: gliding motility-associated C-terminal domain-containing protein, partial [Vicingaceae bacterium]